MNRQILAQLVKPGMILQHCDGERIHVSKVLKAEAVQVQDYLGKWYGLGLRETVTVLGYFNP